MELNCAVCSVPFVVPMRRVHEAKYCSRRCHTVGKRQHGASVQGSRAAEYTTWQGIKARCLNANAVNYAQYGGRGITVCDSWRDSFERFLADMGPKPGGDYSIDRIDNDGPYSPENCHWATRSEQARNRSFNRLLTIDGETRCLSDWADVRGIHRGTLLGRISTGWSPERAISTPVQKGTSGHRGVTWHTKPGRWRADIHKDGKRKFLGLFDDINDAVRAYESAVVSFAPAQQEV